LPSPTGSLVTSTDAFATVAVAGVVAAVDNADDVVADVDVDVDESTFTSSLEPHADAMTNATTHNALRTRRPDTTDDRTAPSQCRLMVVRV
jgi:hypothetical protein